MPLLDDLTKKAAKFTEKTIENQMNLQKRQKQKLVFKVQKQI